MKTHLEYDRSSFKKRMSKVNSIKQRPNSSFIIPSSNYTINALYAKGDKNSNVRKSQEISKYTQLNNSCFYFKNINRVKPKYDSVKTQKKNKIILYEDSIKLKTKINKLNKELTIMKSDNLKKTEEIKKRKRDVFSAKARDKTYENLKEENIISKLKDNYDFLNNKIKILKEKNNKLQNDLKFMNLFFQEQDNINNLILLKQKISQYNINLQHNMEFNNQLFYSYFNREEYFNNHTYIENIQKQIEEKTKKIFLLKQDLISIKKKFNKIEQERKKLMSYISSLEKRNEKLLLDKKIREDFILQKPIIISKINEYEKKIKGIVDENKKNESEIIKLSKASKMILKQMKENTVCKPMNYDKLINIENNPFENINQKIILLESLIKESKERQNEFIEIFEYYDDYVQQKEKYDIINNEAKMIEEKNLLNINNNNDNNNLINDNIINNNINNEKITDESNFEEKKVEEKDSVKNDDNSNKNLIMNYENEINDINNNDNNMENNDNIENNENLVDNNVENNDNIENMENKDNNIENVENNDNIENIENNDNIENIENNDNIENIENNDKIENNENNIVNFDENKNDINAENILNNSQSHSPSSINSKNKEKFNENENDEEIKENNEEIDRIELRQKEISNTKEKKYKNFQFLLSIILMNQGLKKEKIEKIISEKNSDMSVDNYLLNLSKNILNLIDNKNDKDIKTLTKIFKTQLKEKYSNDINIFMENIIKDFLEKNKFTLIQSEDDENLYLTKVIQLYGPSCNVLIQKLNNLQKDDKNFIPYKNLKKLMKEENLYSNEDKEKRNIFKFFTYVLKKNASYIDEQSSINDFLIEDVLNFLKGIFDLISGKKLESDEQNSDDGLTITDEEFKKIMNTFLLDLNKKIEEKNLDLEKMLGEENIKEIEKEGKSIKVIDIYKFVEKLKENDVNLNDNLVISCVFNRYQINENSENININILKNDLEKKQIILV